MNNIVFLETKRLILRPWNEADAEVLYRYAKDPQVGPNAGWLPHADVRYSRAIIRTVLGRAGTFAVVPREGNGEPAGSIGIMTGESAARCRSETEGEIGYWLGVPFWGKGLIPEAVGEILRYGFEELHLQRIWCAYYEGNIRSMRVMEKCGFRYDHMNPDSYNPMLQEHRIEHFTNISYEEWRKKSGNAF